MFTNIITLLVLAALAVGLAWLARPVGNTAHLGEMARCEEYGIEIAMGELLDMVDHILPEEGQHWVSPTCGAKFKSEKEG